MKREYQNPAMEVVVLTYNRTLLNPSSDPDPGGGEAPGMHNDDIEDMLPTLIIGKE